jgi:hypothetical protein
LCSGVLAAMRTRQCPCRADFAGSTRKNTNRCPPPEHALRVWHQRKRGRHGAIRPACISCRHRDARPAGGSRFSGSCSRARSKHCGGSRQHGVPGDRAPRWRCAMVDRNPTSLFGRFVRSALVGGLFRNCLIFSEETAVADQGVGAVGKSA